MIFDNLQKITLSPYKVNQIEKTPKGIIININLVKLILFATYLIGFSGNKGSLKLFPHNIFSVKLMPMFLAFYHGACIE